LKLLTATEWAGVVFALSLIVHTAQGFELFNNLFQHQGNMAGKMTWKIIYVTIMAKKMMTANVAMTVKMRMSNDDGT